MNIEITSRHHDYSDRIIDFAREKVEKLTKYHDRIIDVHMVLDKRPEGEEAEIDLHISGKNFAAKELADDITKSIDLASKKIGRQLKKYVDKRNEKHV
ncbi:MAG: ribosome-associated translation inhibitor RaiA [Candidatus Marinimicrobia bacterium]|nr:ribosome-associated translation inhibitor RaiA [Candidatus Neomarinimicrobiota bacterium]